MVTESDRILMLTITGSHHLYLFKHSVHAIPAQLNFSKEEKGPIMVVVA